MTLGAVQSEMSSGQWESRQVMVKGRRQPSAGGMTGSAIPPESTVVIVILLVTREAVSGGGFEIAIDMATRTGNAGMSPGKFKGKKVMVDIDR